MHKNCWSNYLPICWLVTRWLENTWCTNQSNSSLYGLTTLPCNLDAKELVNVSAPHLQHGSVQATPDPLSIRGVCVQTDVARCQGHFACQVRKEQTGLGRPGRSARYTYVRRLSHLYHLLEQQAGAPSEMLADPELQVLDRVAKTHKQSLLCTVATAPQSCQSMQSAVCLVGALSVFKPSMCSRWCRILTSPVFYTLQAFTKSSSFGNTSSTGPKLPQNQGW